MHLLVVHGLSLLAEIGSVTIPYTVKMLRSSDKELARAYRYRSENGLTQ